jgi:DNA-binding CsgD family transcriptional regulator
MLLQHYFEVSQAPDLESFRKRLVGFAEEMDFGLVNAMLAVDRLGPSSPSVFVSVNNTPEAFLALQRDPDDVRRDPVIKRLKSLSVPFIYDQDLYTEEEAGDLWEAQAPYGYRTGVAVALHLPGHRHFLLGVDRATPLPTEVQALTRIMADLQLLAVHAQAAALRLLLPTAGMAQLPDLSAREVEILRWTMEGKSAWSVGAILAISENTVNFHLRSIFKKLGASSKHQAVLIALRHGLL